MKIIKVPVSQISPAAYNPRLDLKPGDADYEKLKRSITEFGCVEPLVWNEKTGNLVSGHQRMKILIEQGATEIEVSCVSLSIPKEKQLNLILNRVGGDWDDEKLKSVLSELGEIPDFDLTQTGFDLPEISEILDQHHETQEDDFDFEGDIKANKNPVTKLGDILELGDHRVICADSTDPETFKKLMRGQKAGLVDCDFPYNVRYMGGQCPRVDTRPKKSRKWDRIYSDDLPQAEYEDFMRKVLTNITDVMAPGTSIYLWQGHRQFPPMYQILLELGFHISCVICWLKESQAITYADYSFRTEQCLYGWRLGAPHYFAGAPGESNVWEIKRDNTRRYDHPTQKPIALAERAIKNSSKRGDIVLDTFLGSGSVLLGCQSLGRKCYGIELDPKYVDGIARRYIAYVGEENVPQSLKDRFLKKE